MTPEETNDGEFESPYMPDSAGSVLKSFDYTDILEEIAHRLKRQQIGSDDVGNKVWVHPEGIDPLMNDMGVEDLLVLLTSICQRITGLSNIDEEKERNRIFILLKQIGSRLIEILAKNYSKYEIKHPSHLILIYETVMNPIEFSLRQPLGQGGRLFVSETTVQKTEVIERAPEER